MRDVSRALLELLDGTAALDRAPVHNRGALATVVRSSGSTPQRPGARLLMRPDESLVGTVGGGAVEHHVVEVLRACCVDGRPRVVVKDLMRDLGMCCGGRMEVFVEPIEAQARLLLFGAGHVGFAVAKIAPSLGFDVVVIDDREELNTEARFGHCRRVLAEPKEAAADVSPTARDWLLVTTHDHRLDEEALDTYARLPHAYLGMIGSRRKVYRILARVAARAGVPPLERVYAPVGLDLGAVTPEEIAVSVAAELVALRHGKPGNHLRAMDDPQLARVLGGELSPEGAAAKLD